ncbi:unnamed protein product [Soboliphyme baturini]|uniref:Peptidase M12B domain-containing protein n=1 Tax=Soboliphyme baturini TaxID=241478 RepID=A0A183J6J3_9BILA|nr:unnamed protein product [Soboliphyme baturini]
MPKEFLVFQPMPARFVAGKSISRLQPHLVYKRSASLPDQLTLKLAVFTDTRLWQYFVKEFGEESAESELEDFVLALINNVSLRLYEKPNPFKVKLLYQQPSITPKLNIVIVRYEMWKNQPVQIYSSFKRHLLLYIYIFLFQKALAASKHKHGEAQLYLDAFCSYQFRMNDASDNGWNHATLLTGYDIYHISTSVAGVAPVGRMCDKAFSCSLIEGMHLGRSFVLAHEMGHSLGMVHDGVQNQCSKTCCLMSTINGAGRTKWSPCSVREYQAFLFSVKKSPEITVARFFIVKGGIKCRSERNLSICTRRKNRGSEPF